MLMMIIFKRSARENQYQQEHHHSFIHSAIPPFASRKLYSTHLHTNTHHPLTRNARKGSIPFHSIPFVRSFDPLSRHPPHPSISNNSPSSRFSSLRSRPPAGIARPGANGAFQNCHVLLGMCLVGYSHPGDTVNCNKIDTDEGERNRVTHIR